MLLVLCFLHTLNNSGHVDMSDPLNSSPTRCSMKSTTSSSACHIHRAWRRTLPAASSRPPTWGSPKTRKPPWSRRTTALTPSSRSRDPIRMAKEILTKSVAKQFFLCGNKDGNFTRTGRFFRPVHTSFGRVFWTGRTGQKTYF